MAEVECRQCGASVDEAAHSCPDCGYDPVEKQRRIAYWFLGVGALVGITGVGSVIGAPLIVYGLMKYFHAEERSVDESAPVFDRRDLRRF